MSAFRRYFLILTFFIFTLPLEMRGAPVMIVV
jgi:hypothetical protein